MLSHLDTLRRTIMSSFRSGPGAGAGALHPKTYQAWRSLISSHNRFLNLILSSQKAARGEKFISMAFIRAQGTGMFVAVYTMLRHLQMFDESTRGPLEAPFQRLRTRVNRLLATPDTPCGELVLPLNKVSAAMSSSVGTKMAFLGEIRSKFPEVRVPDGFVVTAAGFHLFLNQSGLRGEINRRLQTLEVHDVVDMFRVSSDLQMLFINARLPEQLEEAILSAYRALEYRAGLRGVRVAVRSSAVGEDSMETSFAGQYRNELNVSEDLLLMAYKEVVASKYSLTAISYRLSLGLKDENLPMCVGCMVMEDAVAGGAMYTQDPTSSDTETLYVDAVHGLNKAVTDGYVSPDHWEIAKKPEPEIRAKTIRNKDRKFACFLSEEGTALIPVPAAQRLRPVLTPEQVVALSRHGMALERHFLCPLDVHWSMSREGVLSILQARPLKTVVAKQPSQDTPIMEGKEILARGGQTASPGVAWGPAYVVRSNIDMFQFPEGGVLVARGPNPAWSALLPRAAAVITEQGGGIFGHLANIAREFGIPALFDVPEALSRIEPGMNILVDASQKLVQRVAKQPLEHRTPHQWGTLVGSPVHQALTEVLEVVARPSSANPFVPRLDPERLTSLWDIAHAANLLATQHLLQAIAAATPGCLNVSQPIDWRILDLDASEPSAPSPAKRKSPPLISVSEHPLLEVIWPAIAQHSWTVFAKSPRRTVLGKLLGRLGYDNRHLFASPWPRLFIIAKDLLHLHLHLDAGLFIIQAQNSKTPSERCVALFWQWPPRRRPNQDRLETFRNDMAEHGFLLDILDEGLFSWSSGDDAADVAAKLALVGNMVGTAIQWRTVAGTSNIKAS
ncbi:PEP/pyruvate-binding domain-containing protein [Desulfonatronum parangueonense]